MKSKALHYFAAFLFFTLLFIFFIKGAKATGYEWQWFRVPSLFITLSEGKIILGPILQGLIVTFEISILSFFVTIFFGLLFAIFRISNTFTLKTFGYLYVEIFRNTPLIIQILFFYFVIAPVFNISPFISAILSISLFEGSYCCEIIRAGINSIEKEQWEASQSLGLSKIKTLQHIILPQAIKKVLPALTNTFISLIKDSALVSVIAVYDLTMQAQKLISETFMTFEIWLTVASLYFFINTFLSLLIKNLNKKLLWGEL